MTIPFLVSQILTDKQNMAAPNNLKVYSNKNLTFFIFALNFFHPLENKNIQIYTSVGVERSKKKNQIAPSLTYFKKMIPPCPTLPKPTKYGEHLKRNWVIQGKLKRC